MDKKEAALNLFVFIGSWQKSLGAISGEVNYPLSK